MATTTSAKAGRKEALRSAACRSGAALSAPAAAAGPRLGGEGGSKKMALCFSILFVKDFGYLKNEG